jgi:hypothetical protein
MGTTLENFTKYYVYVLLDPRNFYIPFYVGKGSGNRAKAHLQNRKSDNSFKEAKIKSIRRDGFEPTVLFWQTEISEEQAYKLEAELIQRFGRKGYEENGILTNVCVDNRAASPRGRTMSEETKRKISESNRGRKWSDESRSNASLARTGKARGKPSKETIAKIRDSQIGKSRRKWSQKERENLRNVRKKQAENQTELQRHLFSENMKMSWDKRREKFGPNGRSS